MKIKSKRTRAYAIAAAMSLSLIATTHPARATDPQAGDAAAVPPNLNLLLYYNVVIGSGTVTATNGTNSDHTRLAIDANVFRYIHTVDIGGYTAGVDVVLPYETYLGNQKVDGTSLAHKNGFGQPNFGLFFWPINQPKAGNYLLVSGWVSPPISSFSKINNLTAPVLTPANNLLTEEIEIGARTRLLGTQSTPNLALEGWSTTYFYQENSNYASVNLPSAYGPVSEDVTYHEQPTEEMRTYLTYTFKPEIGAFAAIGFLQSFGGKQTLSIAGVPQSLDTGNRTNESQLRFFLTSFLAPSIQASAFVYYDVAAHGGPKQRIVALRLIKIF